jgi:hypothetical protein
VCESSGLGAELSSLSFIKSVILVRRVGFSKKGEDGSNSYGLTTVIGFFALEELENISRHHSD